MESEPKTGSCTSTLPELRVDAQLCYKLHNATHRFLGRWDRALRRHGINFTEYLLLLAVWERWPVGEHSLGERLLFDPYTLEDALVNLERQRLVTRSDDHGIPGHRVVKPTRESFDLQPEILTIRDQFSCDLGLPKEDALLLGVQLDKLSLSLADMDMERSDLATQPDAQPA